MDQDVTATDAGSAAFRDELVRLVKRRLHSEADAEDVAQDVLLRLSSRPEALPEDDTATAWLHRVVANASTDYFRRRASETRALGRALEEERVQQSGKGEGDAERMRHDLAACMRPLLATLSDEDREALELTDLGGLSQKEAAEQLGIGYSAMKSRVQRARARLRGTLLDCCKFEVDARGAPLSAEPRGHPRCGPDGPA